MRPHGSPAQLEQRRLHALVLLEQGLSPVDVGRRLGVDRRSVRRWKAAARPGGAARPKALPAPGRPPTLARRAPRPGGPPGGGENAALCGGVPECGGAAGRQAAGARAANPTATTSAPRRRASSAERGTGALGAASRSARMAFVDVLRLLESHGVLEVVDGATDSFVDTAEAKVLYHVNSTLLLRLMAAPVGPSQLEVPPEEVALRLDELLTVVSHERRYGRSLDEQSDALPISDVQRDLWLRPSAFRRLAGVP